MDGATLHTWGRGRDGRLGHAESSADHSEPRLVDTLAGVRITGVALGNCHGGAISAVGEVYMWGGGAFGELGLGEDVQQTPRPRLLPALHGHRVMDLSCGFYHTACVTDDGAVWTWGWGRDGQLGHVEASATPMRVDALRERSVSRVACGHHATCVLCRNGDVYLWGDLSGGGGGDRQVRRAELPGGAARAVAVGGKHALVVLGDGRLFAWGEGRHGQLGLGDLTERATPGHVSTLCGVNTASCGEAHSAAVAMLAQPTAGLPLTDHQALGIAAGSSHLWVWGRNRYGGAGAHGDVRGAWPRPLALPGSMQAIEIVSLSCGYHHGACVGADGRVYTWSSVRGRLPPETGNLSLS